MECDLYMLGLLKFKDGKVVFDEQELNYIKEAISNSLRELLLSGRKSVERGVWDVYKLNPRGSYIERSREFTVKSARIGYYHHRVIVHFILDLKDGFLALRMVRKKLGNSAEKIIEEFVKNKINELLPLKKIRKEAEVKFIYTYPLIIVKTRTRKFEPIPFSEETTSMCFEVVEPCWWPPFGKKHMMRISIPSTILYAQRDVGGSLLRDIINAIYQYCLYKKKEIDEEKLEEIKKKAEEGIIEEAREKNVFRNRMGEDLLVRLWEHALETMGGESDDVRIIRITITTRLLALLALIVSSLTLILRLIRP